MAGMLAKLSFPRSGGGILEVMLDRAAHLGRSDALRMGKRGLPLSLVFEAHQNRGEGGTGDERLLGYSSVSNSHATLTPTSEGYVLDDAGSSYGTFVNGEPLTGRRALVSGDEIVLARAHRGARFRYDLAASPINVALVAAPEGDTARTVIRHLGSEGGFEQSRISYEPCLGTGELLSFIESAKAVATRGSTTFLYLAGGLDTTGNVQLADAGLDPALFYPSLGEIRGRKVVVIDVPNGSQFANPGASLPHGTVISVPQRRNQMSSDVPAVRIVEAALGRAGQGSYVAALGFVFASQRGEEPNVYRVVIPASLRPSGPT